MNPSRPLPPVPTPYSSISTQKPTTFEQWQIALKGVQVLYLKRNYKQCAARCTQLLTEASLNIHPIHRTFLLFYTALCKEILARATHNLSSNKLALLHQAQDLYMQASDCLPVPSADSDEWHVEDSDNSELELSSDEAGGNPAHSSAINSTSMLSPALTDASSAPSTDLGDTGESDKEFVDAYAPQFEDELSYHLDPSDLQPIPHKSVFCPAPLRIRKAVHFEQSPEKPRRSTARTFPTPSRLILTRSLSVPRTKPSTSSSVSSFLLNRSLSRYHDGLESFRPHITTHLTAVKELIQTAHTIQELRRRNLDSSLRNSKFFASFWSFKPKEGERLSQEKMERIERLRANGWKLGQTPGVGRWKGSQYYEELCDKAMKELGD